MEKLHACGVAKEKESVASLMARLRKLQLSNHWKRVGDKNFRAINTTMMSTLDFAGVDSRYNHGEDDATLRRTGFIARAIYAEWLTQQEVGQQAYRATDRGTMMLGSHRAGLLSNTLTKIQEHADHPNPGRIFGEKAAEEHVQLLGGDDSAVSVKCINDMLNHLVLHANVIIKEVYQPRTEVEADGSATTYRRACFGRRVVSAHADLTFFGWDESKVPWRYEQEWDCESNVTPKGGAPAGESLLRALEMIILRDLLDEEGNPNEDGILDRQFEETDEVDQVEMGEADVEILQAWWSSVEIEYRKKSKLRR
jgi:hypothetical protein